MGKLKRIWASPLGVEERIEANITAWPSKWEHTYYSGRAPGASGTWDFLRDLNFNEWTRAVKANVIEERRQRKMLMDQRRRDSIKADERRRVIDNEARRAKHKADMADPVKSEAIRAKRRAAWTKKQNREYTEMCKDTQNQP